MMKLSIEAKGVRVVRVWMGNPNETQIRWMVDGMLGHMRAAGVPVTANSPAMRSAARCARGVASFRVEAPMGPIPMRAWVDLTAN